jgi:hypothetical protein
MNLRFYSTVTKAFFWIFFRQIYSSVSQRDFIRPTFLTQDKKITPKLARLRRRAFRLYKINHSISTSEQCTYI